MVASVQGPPNEDERSTSTSCSDNSDNDSDGWADGEDPDCFDGGSESGGASGIAACNDGIDNDSDLLLDCQDPGCAESPACRGLDATGPGDADAASGPGDTLDGEDGDPGPAAGDCLPEATYFECAVWNPFMGSTCLGCHQEGGPGALGSEFSLLPVTGGDLGPNLERVRAIAQKQHEGQPLLLLKASNSPLAPHAGGEILPAGSAEHQNLAALLSYFDEPDFCRPSCDGQVELIEDPDDICSAPPVTDMFDGGAAMAAPPIHTQRLTHWQYRAAVNEVFGEYIDVIDDLPTDSSTGTIPSNENYNLPTADYKRYAVAAATVATRILDHPQQDLEDLFDCAIPSAPDRVCAETFIAQRGMRLFRRPLTDAEVAAAAGGPSVPLPDPGPPDRQHPLHGTHPRSALTVLSRERTGTPIPGTIPRAPNNTTGRQNGGRAWYSLEIVAPRLGFEPRTS